MVIQHSSPSSLATTDSPVPPVAPVALEQALEQSHDVKAKVEACAEDLAQANEGTKKTIAAGATTLPARQTLDYSEAVETKVQECADDLDSVTKSLAQGIDELKVVEIALASSRTALAKTTASLASALESEPISGHCTTTRQACPTECCSTIVSRTPLRWPNATTGWLP
jgi:hypothetical protein